MRYRVALDAIFPNDAEPAYPSHLIEVIDVDSYGALLGALKTRVGRHIHAAKVAAQEQGRHGAHLLVVNPEDGTVDGLNFAELPIWVDK